MQREKKKKKQICATAHTDMYTFNTKPAFILACFIFFKLFSFDTIFVCEFEYFRLGFALILCLEKPILFCRINFTNRLTQSRKREKRSRILARIVRATTLIRNTKLPKFDLISCHSLMYISVSPVRMNGREHIRTSIFFFCLGA